MSIVLMRRVLVLAAALGIVFSPLRAPADTTVRGLLLTSTQQPCPTGDAPVKVTGGWFYPSTATKGLAATFDGYTCAKQANDKFLLYPWSSFSDAECGSGNVADYDSSLKGIYESPAVRTPPRGRAYNYSCETLLAALGWQRVDSLSLTISAQPPNCQPPDVAVAVAGSPNTMAPLTATGFAKAGYACAQAAQTLSYRIFDWASPKDAQCGTGKVVAYNVFSTKYYYESTEKQFSQSFNRYECDSLLFALGYKSVSSIPTPAKDFTTTRGLHVTSTQQPCPAGDVVVWVTGNAGSLNQIVPLTATQEIRAYSGGYSCARAAYNANVTLYTWTKSSDAECGTGNVADYDITRRGYYESPATGGYRQNYSYMCETILAAIGWKSNSAAVNGLRILAAPPSCTGPDVAVAVQKATALGGWMYPLTAKPSKIDGYACAKDALAALYVLPDLSNPKDVQCGTDKIAAYKTVFPIPNPYEYYASTDPQFSAPGGMLYECESLLAALGWKLVNSGRVVVNGFELSKTPPDCKPPDVAVWVSVATKTMVPLSATDVIGQGVGGYLCANAALRASIGLPVWTAPNQAQCGSYKVVAYKPGETWYYASSDLIFSQPGNDYTCEPLAVALSFHPRKTSADDLLFAALTVKNPKCNEPMIDAAYAADNLTLNGSGFSGDCNSYRYAANGWGTGLSGTSLHFPIPQEIKTSFDRLKTLVAASKLCDEPWIGEAYFDGPQRKPTSAECNPSLYGLWGDGAAGYKRLVCLVSAHAGSGPSSGCAKTIAFTGPSGQTISLYSTPADAQKPAPDGCRQGGGSGDTIVYISQGRLFFLDDPQAGQGVGAYTCAREAAKAGLTRPDVTLFNNPASVKCTGANNPVVYVDNTSGNAAYYEPQQPGFKTKPGSGGYLCEAEAKELGFPPSPQPASTPSPSPTPKK